MNNWLKMDVFLSDEPFTLSWMDELGYFGKVTFYKSRRENIILIASETKDKEFIKHLLCQFVDEAELID